MAKARLKALLSIQKCRRTSFPPQGNLLQSFWYDLNLSVEMCRQEGKVPPSCPTCVVVRGSNCLLLPAEQIRPTGYKSCAGRPADCHFSGKSRTLNHGSCCWLFCVWGHSLTRDWDRLLFVSGATELGKLNWLVHCSIQKIAESVTKPVPLFPE